MSAEPIRHEDGRVRPEQNEVGVYWPDQDRTAIYSAGDFYEDGHLQTLADNHGEILLDCHKGE